MFLNPTLRDLVDQPRAGDRRTPRTTAPSITQVDAGILLAFAAGVVAMLSFGFCWFAEGATSEVLVNVYLIPLAMGMALVEAATWAGEHPRLGGWVMLALGLAILPIGLWFTSLFVLQFWRGSWSDMGLRELLPYLPQLMMPVSLGLAMVTSAGMASGAGALLVQEDERRRPSTGARSESNT